MSPVGTLPNGMGEVRLSVDEANSCDPLRGENLWNRTEEL
jgi:hypothetical protein